jgi:AcrR family transcriptional regulator
MRNTKIKIAAAADRLFAERGFAEPGVEAVREAANVSIRTLYKHFPSKEAMVVGALAHRHERYLAHLRIEAPIEPGLAAILHLFGRVEDWMQKSGARGCLFLQALAAHPDSDAIASEVARNKREVRREIGRRLPDGRDDVVPTLFLLHEGVTAAGENAAEAAREAVSIVRMVL